jgi:hypothetical protein
MHKVLHQGVIPIEICSFYMQISMDRLGINHTIAAIDPSIFGRRT